MTNEEKILKRYGATEIESYSLISNYGYRFKIDGIKYDIRFWANCYGASPNRWEIYPSTPNDLAKKIEAEFNA